MSEATRFLVISDNLFRYSENEALEGSYLNAVIILDQVAKDVDLKLRQGVISDQQAKDVLHKIDTKQRGYILSAKTASPRKFEYDEKDCPQKLDFEVANAQKLK